VDYRGLSVTISIKITLNIIDIAMNVTSLVGCNNRLEFIIIIVEKLEMLFKRYNFN
jgi:hypothetical protein